MTDAEVPAADGDAAPAAPNHEEPTSTAGAEEEAEAAAPPEEADDDADEAPRQEAEAAATDGDGDADTQDDAATPNGAPLDVKEGGEGDAPSTESAGTAPASPEAGEAESASAAVPPPVKEEPPAADEPAPKQSEEQATEAPPVATAAVPAPVAAPPPAAPAPSQAATTTAAVPAVAAAPPIADAEKTRRLSKLLTSIKRNSSKVKASAAAFIDDLTNSFKSAKVKYGGKVFTMEDELPADCIPEEPEDLRELIKEFNSGREAGEEILQALDEYYAKLQAFNAAEKELAAVLIDIGMHQEGKGGKAINSYGEAHKEATNFRKDRCDLQSEFLLGPFRTHVTVATADTVETLKTYEKSRKLVGLQIMKVKGLKERGRPADRIAKEEKKLETYMKDFEALQDHTRAKVR
mmetsp:Transcript_12840/g.46933  ORF Transcript_12840/g.46933 Transcript_12840/m.46933 type:complete len:407 (-) Transcript_12840:2085-3305(-)